jgi:hypothetical protein
MESLEGKSLDMLHGYSFFHTQSWIAFSGMPQIAGPEFALEQMFLLRSKET